MVRQANDPPGKPRKVIAGSSVGGDQHYLSGACCRENSFPQRTYIIWRHVGLQPGEEICHSIQHQNGLDGS